METGERIEKRGRALHTIEFCGKLYKLHKGERYFSRGNKRLHVEVWKHHNGQIPKGFDIHHIDWNHKNNSIENLKIVLSKDHQSFHAKKRFIENPEHKRKFYEAGIIAAKEWHKSEEGKQWHSQHAKNTGFGKFEYGESNCIQCSEKYTRKSSTQHFCSNKCKSKYRRDNGLDDEIRKCDHCGQVYSVNRFSKQRYCSMVCGRKGCTKNNKI
jgi:hypothetical protein